VKMYRFHHGQVWHLVPVPGGQQRSGHLLALPVFHQHLHRPVHAPAAVLLPLRCATPTALLSLLALDGALWMEHVPALGHKGRFLLPHALLTSDSCVRAQGTQEHGTCVGGCRCSLWALALCSGDCECCLLSCTGSFRVGSVGQAAEVQLTYPSLSSSCAWYLTPTKYVHVVKSACAAVAGNDPLALTHLQSLEKAADILPICEPTAVCLHALPSAGTGAACPPRTTCSCPW
jgi:hypothetical protein